MHPDDLEHPDAVAEAMLISRTGGADFDEALGEMVEVLNRLFDGPGNPPHVHASGRPEDLFYEDAPVGGVRYFTRQFWSLWAAASVVAVVGVKGGRPALLAVVPVGLDGLPSGPFDYRAAVASALALARGRAAAM